MKRLNRTQSLACIALAMVALSAPSLRAESPLTATGGGERRQELQAKKPTSDEKRREAEAERQREKKQKEADKKRQAQEAKKTQPQTFEFAEHGFKYTSAAGWMAADVSGPNFVHGLIFRTPRRPSSGGDDKKESKPSPTPLYAVRVSALASGRTIDEFAKDVESEWNCHNTYDVQPVENASIDGIDGRVLTLQTKPDVEQASKLRCLVGVRDGKGYAFQLITTPDAFDAALTGTKRMESSVKWLSKDATTKPSDDRANKKS